MTFILRLLLLLPLTTAFDISLISGTYTLSKGSCPSPLTISQNSTTISADSLSLSNTPCNTTLTLAATAKNKTELHTFLSKTPEIGSFLTTPQNLTCGNFSLSSITLFETTKQIQLPSSAFPSIGAGVTLKKDFVFLLTEKCVYQREKMEEDGIVQQILNTVTECLPGDALINTETGLKQVSKLSQHDLVHTTEGSQPILTWTHRDHITLTRFTKILFHGSNHSLELTSGHYVYTDQGLQPAGAIRAGMVMQTKNSGLVVRAVGTVTKKGLFNPHTATGDFFVGKNGVRISCYTSAVEPVIAHALLAPVRGGFMMDGVWISGFGQLVERLAERFRYSGIVSWFSV